MKALYKKGFTMVEILVIVAIVALLSAVAYYSFAEARVRAVDSAVLVEVAEANGKLGRYVEVSGYYPSPSLANRIHQNTASGMYVENNKETGTGFTDIANAMKMNFADDGRDIKYLCIDNDNDGHCNYGAVLPDIVKKSTAATVDVPGVPKLIAPLLSQEIVKQRFQCADPGYMFYTLEATGDTNYSGGETEFKSDVFDMRGTDYIQQTTFIADDYIEQTYAPDYDDGAYFPDECEVTIGDINNPDRYTGKCISQDAFDAMKFMEQLGENGVSLLSGAVDGQHTIYSYSSDAGCGFY